MNKQIRSKKIRLIDDEGKQLGEFQIDSAIELAESRDLDIVEVAPNADPPVCKIMDYGKYRYEQAKKEKMNKKKQHHVEVKEIRFRPRTDEHDLRFKLKHARKFLEQGFKVKTTITFRGRELAHKEFGEELLEHFREDLSDIAVVEQEPKMEGRNLIAYFKTK